MRKLMFASLVGGLSLVAASPAAAQDGQLRIGIAPLEYANGAYFDLTMEPGESRELKVELGNYGGEAVTVRSYAADVYTIPNGGFGARLDGDPTSGTTLWLDYQTQELELGPQEALHQAFTVRVPGNAAPGEYITSLVVQNAEALTATNGSIAINQVQRQAIAVAVTVPGPRRPALTIGGFEHGLVAGRSVISASLTNTGNVRLKPSGEFVIEEDGGKILTRFSLQMDSFYAGTTTVVDLPFDTALPPGRYEVSLALEHEGGWSRSEPGTVEVVEEFIPPVVGPDGSRLASLDPDGTAGAASFPIALLVPGGLAVALGAVLLMGARRTRASEAVSSGLDSVLLPVSDVPSPPIPSRPPESRLVSGRWRGQRGSKG